jgi:hypothetical protein
MQGFARPVWTSIDDLLLDCLSRKGCRMGKLSVARTPGFLAGQPPPDGNIIYASEGAHK